MSSILVTDADESATLQATLAFLDAWGPATTDSSVYTSTSSPHAPTRCLTPQQKQQQDHHSLLPKRRTPRRKYPNSSSTVLQRRKKAEILALRTQVEQLEGQLVQLRQVPGVKSALEEADDALIPRSWAQQAAVQYRDRLRAEKTNVKLKNIMANQIKVSEALRTVLQKASAMKGMDFLHPDPCRPLANDLFEMELLEQRVESLFLDADAMFNPDRMNSISVEAIVKQNQALGKTMEIKSTTPMLCPLKTASDTLWNWFSMNKPLRKRPNTLERMYTLLLESQIGILEFRKQNFVRRYEETDRVVIVWADVLSLPKYKLQFRNQAWLFITPSSDAPKDASVLRTFQQVFMDYDESRPVEGASFAKEFAFQELSKLYRRFLQGQQNVMMEETWSPAVTPGVTV